ncbi:quinolinate synthase NadA [Methanobrevibacter sp. OttesenSCG-928-K11]|nr:quinolinate synthase NadA [Methanobrevibacter sp. OttesenSCG-928-K11]MDL2270584.1 quinolinate synthase NadA [Methanobrevibacter sp. OttesenSCG-928-I08]
MSKNLKNEIETLKNEKNAIILAHNYQPKEVQEISDFVGDSLELCIKASELEDKDIIVFCGVDFMGETAYILNPNKKIIIPDLEADCPMAHMLTGEQVRNAKKEHPNAAVCLYVNSLADAKQDATTLCTSSNALKVIESLDEDEILFGPDNNLGNYVRAKTSKKIIPIADEGYCYVHKKFTPEDVKLKRKENPDIEIICHPECDMSVQNECDYVLSTGGMLNHIANSEKEEFILATEVDMISRIELEIPGKKAYPLREDAVCDSMKLHTLEKIRDSLKNESPEITLPEDVAKKSLKAVQHMLNASK